ncbi:MAG TPA: Trk system potassium transporter TrkA [Thermodesulfobacteriota bacterium]|nr:Trk system potassium transporter TrkA [Thermodesulfobacteriota bacterium]
MRIVIIGSGEVGTFLANNLSDEHDIVIIEKNKQQTEYAKEHLDALIIHGEGDNPNVLKQAEIEKADIMLAVSGNDRTNILASIISHSLGIERIIARIRDPDYFEYPQVIQIPQITVVNSGLLVAEKIANLISTPFAWKTETFASGKIRMLKLRIEDNSLIEGKKLSEMDPPQAWIFVAISRDGEISIPTGDTRLKKGDYVFALGIPSISDKLEALLGVKREKVDMAIISGGGRVGRRVARTLIENGIEVRVIESDHERAELIAEELPEVMVFDGDATNKEILKEAGAAHADYYVALTGDDEKNVLSALLAKNLGTKRSTVLYTKPDYIDLIESIGVDRAISVRLSTANEILSMLHLKGVAHVALIEEGKAEILEFMIHEHSKILGVPLHKAGFPKDSIVGIVVRGEEIIIPRGGYVSEIGDMLIIFCLPGAVKTVEKILS